LNPLRPGGHWRATGAQPRRLIVGSSAHDDRGDAFARLHPSGNADAAPTDDDRGAPMVNRVGPTFRGDGHTAREAMRDALERAGVELPI
jgi:hypothetical protein